MIFNTSDVGLILSGAKDSNAIIARYPEAPACPMEEYKVAIMKNKMNAPATKLNDIINYLKITVNLIMK